jgi:ankyrin repeat protein
VLLESGTSVHVRNKDRQTPFQIASEKGNQEILALLREHMSRQ